MAIFFKKKLVYVTDNLKGQAPAIEQAQPMFSEADAVSENQQITQSTWLPTDWTMLSVSTLRENRRVLFGLLSMFRKMQNLAFTAGK